MPQRQYNKERVKVTKANKRIILPISLETYNERSQASESFRKMVDEMIELYPELFPAGIEAGYWLHDQVPVSKKLADVQVRRIKVKQVDSQSKEQVFSRVSSDVLPYMTGYTDDVEKALYLRRYGVPFSGLSYVFGRDDNYWYRLVSHFGRYEIVSTTVKVTERLPVDLVADEKHLHFNGEKGYLATTVGGDCVLGVSLALAADEAALTEAYQEFRQEAEQLVPNYTQHFTVAGLSTSAGIPSCALTRAALSARWAKASFYPWRLHCPPPIRRGRAKSLVSNPTPWLAPCWDEGHKDPWLIVTDLLPQQADVFWYSLRSWIECGFKQTKRTGWQWQATKMTAPACATRLWLAVATLWVVSVGSEAEDNRHYSE